MCIRDRYNTFIYQPIFNLLIWLFNVIPGHDIGLAIIALTIIIRLVLYPLTLKSLKSQKALQDIQPKIKKLQEDYKDNKESLAAEMMKLYKEEKVSPFSSCLPVLIQLPFLIAVYQVFRDGLLSEGFDHLYSFVANPGTINPLSLGFLDLSQRSIVLALLSGLAQFWQTRMMMHSQIKVPENKPINGAKDEKMLSAMNKQMMYIMPLMTVVIGFSLPAGLTLYWFLSTLFMGIQQMIMFKKKSPAVVPAVGTVTVIKDEETGIKNKE